MSLTCTLVATLSAVRAETSAKDVLWLPLGDSITWGCTGPTIQVVRPPAHYVA